MLTHLDPRGPLPQGITLVDASAGTGKTWTITSLVLRLVVEEGLTIDRVLVVTFTDAATAELRDRVRGRLRMAERAYAGQAVPDELVPWLVARSREAGTAERDRQRVHAALAGFDQAAISTIHGFCRRLLVENAFESGVRFDTEVLADQGPLVEEILGDFWVRELAHLEPEVVARLQEHPEHPLSAAFLRRLAWAAVADREAEVLPGGAALPLALGRPTTPRSGLDLALRLAPWARQELSRRKAAQGAVSYDDLLYLLDEALASESGPALVSAVRSRYGAALIDEFQDTDPVQYRIFGRIFGDSGWLYLIGDPKQAIYSFRGADIHAYLAAAADAGERRYTLETNWRTDAPLLAALEQIYSVPTSPFVHQDIPFVRVQAHHDQARLRFPGGARPPLVIRWVTEQDVGWIGKKGPAPRLAKGWAWQNLPGRVAADVASLLESRATIDKRPIQPGDIAVLVRKHRQAEAVQQALRDLAIPSVRHGASSVFHSPAAQDLTRVLAAAAEPSRLPLVRAALTTVSMGLDAPSLVALEAREPAWESQLEVFRSLHRRWTEQGFIQMFRAWLALPGLQAHVLSLVDGERRMTDLLHLSELLHRASRDQGLGPGALLRWLHRELREGGDSEAAQVRLESDSLCVQVVTVHKAKGLEYPVVFAPYLWDGWLQPDDQGLVRFHDPEDGWRLKLDPGSPDQDEHRRLTARELHAENLRLTYVALTRAMHRCVVYHGPFTHLRTSPLGHLLHPAPGAQGVEGLRRTAARISRAHPEELRQDLDALAEASGGTIAITGLPEERTRPWTPHTDKPPVLDAVSPTRRLSSAWRSASFSSLAEGEHVPVSHEPPHQGDAPQVALADFPAGAGPGTFLHAILEHADFQDAAALPALVSEHLAVHGLDERWASPVSRALGGVFLTRLWPRGPRLADIPRDQRLDELGFVLPVRDPRQEQPGLFRAPTAPLASDHLASVLRRHASPQVPAEWIDALEALDWEPLQGFLRGFVDLIFEHGGRWWVVDYKSNHLGDTASCYDSAALTASMAGHHYFLQYHLYLVALHRYLRWRLPRYEPGKHLGGACYLYLRGMGPAHDPGLGVFVDRVSPQCVVGLSAALGEP